MSTTGHSRHLWFALVATILALPAAFARAEEVKIDQQRIEFFETKIRPLLVANCYNCHSANTNARGGLRVDDRNGLLEGGNRGPAVVAGDPEGSLILRAVSHEMKGLQMPPEKRLSDDEIADLTRWIKEGAHWTPLAHAHHVASVPTERYERLKRDHWAWQPLQQVAPPESGDPWPRDDIDRFIWERHQAEGLQPVGDADKVPLLRRVTFDLTGLPPTPREIDDFVKDDTPAAFTKVVDRLLASPAFGERWGRHWLDVARFGESTGSSRNLPFPHAWRYRDYVIDAFNDDKPYDEFVREQIAGDLLPAETVEEREEHLVATGFLAVGVKDVNQRFKVRFVMDNIDEQIDTVSRSILGLTVSCARCHDHKFDPIATTDYYALAGIFKSTDLCAGVRNKMGGGGLDYYNPESLIALESDPVEVDPARIARVQKAFEQARREWLAIRGTPEGLAKGPNGRPKQRPYRLKMERLQAELLSLTDPTFRGGAAMGVREASRIADTEVRIRGEAEQLGPVVPRGLLDIPNFAHELVIPSEQSGRLELAQWLTHQENALAQRVIVNRVWQHLFGRGLVASVDNFGVTGDAPSHPELLDYLAARFTEEGWSTKRLIRQIVLSRTYGLDSSVVAENQIKDPANRHYWRHNPRRLDAEEIRDAMLAASGRLDLARPEGSLAGELKVVELQNTSRLARRIEERGRASTHRSLYLPLVRGLTPTSLHVFDFAEQGMVTGSRDVTVVATQALYLLNDPFVRRESLNMARRLLSEVSTDSERVKLAYRLTLGREPTETELQRAAGYLAEYELAARDAEQAGAIAANTLAATSEPIAAAKAGSSPSPGADDPPLDPDQIVPVEAPVVEESLGPVDPHTAAWASFCQALLGSVEFRYAR